MVQAILDGRKTQTRRTRALDALNKEGFWVYSHNSIDGEVPRPAKKYDTATYYLFNPKNSNMMSWVFKCPYGEPGDVLWVRETSLYDDEAGIYKYAADFDESDRNYLKGSWTPSIHMPKEAARIWLEVVSVRVERLKDISEQDAIAEGIYRWPDEMEIIGGTYKWYDSTLKRTRGGVDPKTSFMSLWRDINGPESWDANPWVWVIEFKQINKPTT